MKKCKIKTKCKYCDKEFEAYQKSLDKGNSKFCSQVCRYSSKRIKRILKKCEVCSKFFERTEKENFRKNSKVRFCSRKCYNNRVKVPNTKIEKFCRKCRKSFIDWPNSKIKYCSLSCACSRENNGRWRGGKIPITVTIRGLEEGVKWRASIFQRDNYTCQQCLRRGASLEAHHKKPFALIFKEFLQKYSQFSQYEDKETLIRLSTSYPDFWDINNGQTLCKECHKRESKRQKERIKNGSQLI